MNLDYETPSPPPRQRQGCLSLGVTFLSVSGLLLGLLGFISGDWLLALPVTLVCTSLLIHQHRTYARSPWSLLSTDWHPASTAHSRSSSQIAAPCKWDEQGWRSPPPHTNPTRPAMTSSPQGAA